MASVHRSLPAVHRLAAHDDLQRVCERHGQTAVTDACRAVIADLRRRIVHDRLSSSDISAACSKLPRAVLDHLAATMSSAYPAVVNATGVMIHTNLGRAPLGHETAPSLASYLALEYDLAGGRRGQRLAPLRDRIAGVCGAEWAVMVNNNAAALLLILAATAIAREVVVSRGQLIEIGGSFRLPDVMAASGARLVEVGCTNRTHLADYERAIGADTAAILIAHQSNFRIIGFTTMPRTRDLARIAHERGLPLIVDQGSGCLHDLGQWGFAPEPTVSELLSEGADIVCFSGDKLLGGPQAGLIVGHRKWVEPLGRHPLYRALRPDKTALVTMDRVLQSHRTGHLETIPLYNMLATPVERLRRRARSLGRRLRAAGVPVRGQATHCALGGGTTPAETAPSYGLTVAGGQRLADALRSTDPPVAGRLEQDQVVLDLRTVLPGQDRALEQALTAAWRQVFPLSTASPNALR